MLVVAGTGPGGAGRGVVLLGKGAGGAVDSDGARGVVVVIVGAVSGPTLRDGGVLSWLVSGILSWCVSGVVPWFVSGMAMPVRMVVNCVSIWT